MSFIPNREELAWAAGFFDGEGSFLILKHNLSIRCAIGQIHSDMLERFQRAIGGFGSIGKRKPSRLSTNPMYYLQVSNFEHVQAMAAMLWPWLGSHKRAQHRAVLAQAKTNPFWGTARSLRARRSWRGTLKSKAAQTNLEVTQNG